MASRRRAGKSAHREQIFEQRILPGCGPLYIFSRRPLKERRLLELLAAADAGTTDALLLAKGFTIDQMVGLVRAGLATAESKHIFAVARPVEISRVRITDAGRRALVDRDDKIFL